MSKTRGESGRTTIYTCDECDDTIEIWDSDGDREDLEGWHAEVHLQTGIEVSIRCSDCTLLIDRLLESS